MFRKLSDLLPSELVIGLERMFVVYSFESLINFVSNKALLYFNSLSSYAIPTFITLCALLVCNLYNFLGNSMFVYKARVGLVSSC